MPAAELKFGGGLNQLGDESIHPEECTVGENFLLNADSHDLLPRPGFDLKGTATNGGVTRGIMQLVKRDNSETTLVQSSEKVYLWNGSTGFTDKTPVASTTVATDSLLRGEYWSLNDLLIITDVSGKSPVWQWNGTSITQMTHGITGVTELRAKYSLVFNNRLWLFNINTDGSLNPHMVLASEYENYDNFNNAVTPTATSLTFSDPFFILSPDLKAINSVEAFFDTMLISTVDGKLFKLTGSDATDYAITEYYSGSSACGTESMANIGNDVVYMRRGGTIERFRSTEANLDSAADDVSIQIPLEIADCPATIAIYDERNQRIAFFLETNRVLIYDKYIGEAGGGISPWMKWTTQMASNLDVEAATFLRRPGTQNYTVYFGGPAGQIYDLNGSGTGDPGSTLIKMTRKSALISGLNTLDEFVEGRIQYRRKDVNSLSMEFEWTDEFSKTPSVVPLKNKFVTDGTIFWGSESDPAYWGGSLYWGAALTEEDRVSTVGFSAVGKGPSFFLLLTINTVDDWHINKINTS